MPHLHVFSRIICKNIAIRDWCGTLLFLQLHPIHPSAMTLPHLYCVALLFIRCMKVCTFIPPLESTSFLFTLWLRHMKPFKTFKLSHSYKDNLKSAWVGSAQLPSSTTAMLSSILKRVNMLIVGIFWGIGGCGEWQTWGGVSKGKEERETGRVYWLVSSSSVDCDKFNRGNPLKERYICRPAPHHLSLSVCLFCPSAVLSLADLCGQISCVCYVLMDTWGVSLYCMGKLQQKWSTITLVAGFNSHH